MRFDFLSPSAGVLVLAMSVSGLMVGCQKSANDTTVGEKVDAAIAKTKDVASDVQAEAKTALSDAESRYKQDGPKVEDRAREAAGQAGRMIDDSAITAQVSAQLARDPELSAIKIDVDTKDGAVVLRGPAPNIAASERATGLARAVPGVVSVTNQLIVKAG